MNLPHCVVGLSWCAWDHTTWEKRWIYRRQIDLRAVGQGRVLLKFEGSMTAATPYLNGVELLETLGGYLPFWYEMTSLVKPGVNELAVIVDGRWLEVPPSGGAGGAASIDFLQPAGLYRHVALWTMPTPARLIYIWVDPSAAPSGSLDVAVVVRIETTGTIDGYRARASLSPPGSTTPLARAEAAVPVSRVGQVQVTVVLPAANGIGRWSFDTPHPYQVSADLLDAGGVVADSATIRTGFRQAEFRADGFYLNGERQ